MLLDDFSKHGVSPKIELETSSKEILKVFAANGLGVAFMPATTQGNRIFYDHHDSIYTGFTVIPVILYP
jgi:hypothetical protein